MLAAARGVARVSARPGGALAWMKFNFADDFRPSGLPETRDRSRKMGKKMALSHILVEHRYEAEDVLRKLSGGEEFETLARKFSKCPSAKQGGDLGTIDLDRLDPDFAEAAELLQPGQVSPLVRTRFGTHIIKRRDA